MTMNEELRRQLAERGVEWEAFDVFEQTTEWSTYNGAFVYWARERDGKLLVETTAPTKCSASCTPEQAVIITLGPGTCHDNGGIDENGQQVFECDACGCILSLYDRDGVNTMCTHFVYDYPRFCPACGAKVVSE